MQKIFLEKIINDVGVDNTNKLLKKMKNKTNPQFTFKSGQSTQCFKDGIIKKRWSIYTLKVGLCMIQWTNSRTHELIDEYINYKNVSLKYELYINDESTSWKMS